MKRYEYAQLLLGGPHLGNEFAYYFDVSGNYEEAKVLDDNLIPALNLLGRDGWEAFAATVAITETIYLRREISE